MQKLHQNAWSPLRAQHIPEAKLTPEELKVHRELHWTLQMVQHYWPNHAWCPSLITDLPFMQQSGLWRDQWTSPTISKVTQEARTNTD